jgi:hypothetical protein
MMKWKLSAEMRSETKAMVEKEEKNQLAIHVLLCSVQLK